MVVVDVGVVVVFPVLAISTSSPGVSRSILRAGVVSAGLFGVADGSLWLLGGVAVDSGSGAGRCVTCVSAAGSLDSVDELLFLGVDKWFLWSRGKPPGVLRDAPRTFVGRWVPEWTCSRGEWLWPLSLCCWIDGLRLVVIWS